MGGGGKRARRGVGCGGGGGDARGKGGGGAVVRVAVVQGGGGGRVGWGCGARVRAWSSFLFVSGSCYVFVVRLGVRGFLCSGSCVGYGSLVLAKIQNQRHITKTNTTTIRNNKNTNKGHTINSKNNLLLLLVLFVRC